MTSTDPTSTTLAAATAALRDALARPLQPGLHIVATPIGNLADITLRAIATLAAADIIYCEDTRHSRTLTAHFGIKTPLRSFHDHNADATTPEILAALADGKRIALISDAGTPLISDPGYTLVRDALAAGHVVHAIPGPSAAITALSIAGLPTDTFLFAGFLPPKQQARRTRLAELQKIDATLVFYEAPQRIAVALRDMADAFATRTVVVARELTKIHEEARRGTAADLAHHFDEAEHRGEFVVLVAPPTAPAAPSDAEIEHHVVEALRTMSVKDAARSVAEALKLPRSQIYDLALRLKNSPPSGSEN